MAFKKGDKVRFLNDIGGGIVTQVDHRTVYVRNEDGFDIPVSESELIKADVNGSMFSDVVTASDIEPEQQEKPLSVPAPIVETIDYIDISDDQGIPNIDPTVQLLLTWTAERKKNGKTVYNLHLINDCEYHIMYVSAMVTEGVYRGIQAGMLENDSIMHLTTIADTDLKEISKILIECLFFKKGAFMPQEPMKYELKIEEFYVTDASNYQPNDYFESKALIFNITEESLLAEIENVSKELQSKFEKQKKHIDDLQTKARPVVKKQQGETEEVDLHIEQLVDNDPKSLSPAEMLDIQMARFNIALEGAIRNHTKRIVFIHGVGNGRLRLEIRRVLDQKYPKLRYQDASFKEYGYGATLIFL